MMKVEHWVVRSPLGSTVAIRRSSTARAETSHIASHDEMGTTVGALYCPVRMPKEAECKYQTITYPWAFEIGLETCKVAKGSVQHEVVVSFCKAPVDHDSWVDGRSQRIVGERFAG